MKNIQRMSDAELASLMLEIEAEKEKRREKTEDDEQRQELADGIRELKKHKLYCVTRNFSIPVLATNKQEAEDLADEIDVNDESETRPVFVEIRSDVELWDKDDNRNMGDLKVECPDNESLDELWEEIADCERPSVCQLLDIVEDYV